MNILPFTTTSKRVKYLGVNLTKESKDFYEENFKLLKKDKNTRKQKDTSCSRIGRINAVKMTISPVYLQSYATPIKILISL